MERVDVIKDMCQQLNLTQTDNSWIKTLGGYLNVPQLPGPDDYEQRVFVAGIANTTGTSINIGNTNLDITNGATRTLTFGTDPSTFAIKDEDGNVLRATNTGKVTIGYEAVDQPNIKFRVFNNEERYGIWVSQTVENSGTTIGVNAVNTGGATNTTTYGGSFRATGSGTTMIGTIGTADGVARTESIGGRFSASNSTVRNTGIDVNVTSTAANPYLGRFRDGREGTGKVITCVDSNGYSTWGKVDSTYTSGATGTFTAGTKTITVTNGLITGIV